jgi:hypothetical protein
MRNIHLNKIGILILVITVAFFPFFFVQKVRAQSNCVNLSHDLSLGSNDSGSDGSILIVQNYLKSLGYLSAASNGHFGPLTLSAVKMYQTINGISPTGYVGPQTRASINQKTCSVGNVNTNIVNPAPAQSAAPSTAPAPTVSSTDIFAPATGQTLSIGSSTLIRWSRSFGGNYNISLEQPGGAGAGFIALSQSSNVSGNQYLWKVGNIYSSLTNSNQNISPGTYRIRLQGANTGSTPNDEVSGWFTVIAPQFSVTSVMPSSVYADDASSAVLLGSGFTQSTYIYFDSNYSNLQPTNRYTSPDGTVIVFTVPTTVTPGSHTLFINNGQSSSPLTLPFVVTAAK